MIFGEEKITTGASSDIKMVSDMARRMVTEWGMSEKLGFLAYGADQQEVFLGHSVTQTKNLSDATAKSIDEETRRIIDDAYRDASKILSDNKNELETLARGLLEYETLSGDEIQALSMEIVYRGINLQTRMHAQKKVDHPSQLGARYRWQRS